MLWHRALYKLLRCAGLCFFIAGMVLASFYITFQYRKKGFRSPHGTTQRDTATAMCQSCREEDAVRRRVLQLEARGWERREESYQKLRSGLSRDCRGTSEAVMTQENTPLGSKVIYDGEKHRHIEIDQKIFSTFPQESPVGNVTFASCAVIGNGGILLDSGCGEEIDRADFVVRCNLPPVDGRYYSDVGNKTDLVTANPSILLEKFAALSERRRPFADCVSRYGVGTMLALPAFSYGRNTPLSLRALYTLQDFGTPARPVFLNPRYLGSLAKFWRARGLRALRLSTGLMVTSLALELCSSVRLYGFWPFNRGPDGSPLRHHYYDDQRSLTSVHAMPAEFSQLLGLHGQGVLRIQLRKCQREQGEERGGQPDTN
ncbi:alpha-2,8-sialyltransferase 8F-like isoform X1 [Acipenser oxyrinchus oxyrinchus]|uniref:Alpha-2,8-sialyltransferase 8F-like isoform X1 n=1 Tax=Acipenser oxyrinchus oxyrinchus TaxID=40147 RepID=A0AAD8CY52_ACIOX|nr:alpha-2,8-sialyltransferase 8F-like isoform X1 [Acipenser oxyrinchus oxyrinchus]